MDLELVVFGFDLVMLAAGLAAAAISRREVPHAGRRVYILSLGLILLAVVHGLESYMSVATSIGVETIELVHRVLVLIGFVCLLVGIRIVMNSLRSKFEQEQQLLGKVVRAEESNRLKSEFVAFASHEIKGPLTVIGGYAELLTLSSALPPAERAWAETVGTEASRLVRIVSNLLDATKLDLGALEVSRERLELRKLVAHLTRVYQMRSSAHRIEIAIEDEDEGGPLVIGDADRLSQVLGNLIDNAIKYSPAGGDVRVTCKTVGPIVEVSVADSGVGITADAARKIFEKFARSEDHVRAFPGSGIGLFITRELVERMGGAISVQSTPGEGSTFTVVLPAAEPASLAA